MNRTRTFEVGGLLSSMSARSVEKQLSQVPGVTAVAVTYVAGSASVSFEADRTTPEKIRAAIEVCGYHCGGENTPAHEVAAIDLNQVQPEVPGISNDHPNHRVAFAISRSTVAFARDGSGASAAPAAVASVSNMKEATHEFSVKDRKTLANLKEGAK